MENEPKVIKVSDRKMKLEDVQKLVGGYIQEICTNNSDKQYWVNEEGLIYGLPQNHEASQILGQPVVGNLVVLSGISKLD